MDRWKPCTKNEACCLADGHDHECATMARVLADFATAWIGRAATALRRGTPR